MTIDLTSFDSGKALKMKSHRFRFGIRFSLTLAMVGMLCLSVTLAIYGLVTLGKVRGTLRQLPSQDLSRVLIAQEIADQMMTLEDRLSTVKTVTIDDDRLLQFRDIDKIIGGIRQRLAQFPSGRHNEGEDFPIDLSGGLNQLQQDLTHFDRILGQYCRLRLKREMMDRKVEEAYAGYMQAVDEANRQMRAMVARALAIDIPDAARQSELDRRLDAFSEREMSWLGTTQDLRTDGRELWQLAGAANAESDPVKIDRMLRQARLVSQRIAVYRRLPETPISRFLTGEAEKLIRLFGDSSPETLFSLRKEELGRRKEIDQVYAGIEMTVGQLRQDSSTLVLGLHRRVEQRVEKTSEESDRAQRLLLGLAIAGACLSLFALRYIVMKRVVGRVEALTEEMLQAASEAKQGGQVRLDHAVHKVIRSGQNNEIGAMGEALVVFAETIAQQHNELERRVLERTRELTEANAALVIASRTKNEFVTNMNHELRTPLNAIIGFTELVLFRQCGELNETQAEYLGDVLQSSRHLLSLINDILDLAKIEAGKLTLQLGEVHLKGLLERSLVVVREKASKHGIELRLETDGIPEIIWADERKVKQVLFNLLSNAVKFTPDGGRISLKAKWLRKENGHWMDEAGTVLPLSGPGDLRDGNEDVLRISVEDTGIGIKKEDMSRLFQPFEQVDSSMSRRYQGTGLGLSLTRRLLELHGGTIWVESEGEGRGSTFHFLLPVRDMATLNQSDLS